MSDRKNIVARGLHCCPICGVSHDHQMEILISKKINKEINDTVLGYAMCAEHDKLDKAGYVCLIGAEPPMLDADGDDIPLNLENVVRTGESIHIKRDVFSNMTGADVVAPLVFVDAGIIESLTKMANADNEQEKVH